jgi:hypothetical protein
MLFRHAHLLGSPEAKQLVPARLGLEAELRIMSELRFLALFAILESGHLLPSPRFS